MSWATPITWFLHCAVGGGLLLLLTVGLMRLPRQPAQQQRVGEWGLAAALLLAALSAGPAWLPIRIAWPEFAGHLPVNEPQSRVGRDEAMALAYVDFDIPVMPEDDWPALAVADRPAPQASPSDAGLAEPGDIAEVGTWAGPSLEGMALGLLLLYAMMAAGLLARWLVGHAALQYLLWRSRPAPGTIRQVVAELPEADTMRPRLLISERLRSPVSCGILRPTIVLPGSLCQLGPALRWVSGPDSQPGRKDPGLSQGRAALPRRPEADRPARCEHRPRQPWATASGTRSNRSPTCSAAAEGHYSIPVESRRPGRPPAPGGRLERDPVRDGGWRRSRDPEHSDRRETHIQGSSVPR